MSEESNETNHSTPADQPAADPANKPGKTAKPAKPRTFIINIAKEKGENSDVFVGFNGVGYQIKRGQNVEVPEGVLNVLRDAVTVEYDPETMQPQEVPSYPFNIVGQA